jgi:hypothetical protein
MKNTFAFLVACSLGGLAIGCAHKAETKATTPAAITTTPDAGAPAATTPAPVEATPAPAAAPAPAEHVNRPPPN